MAPSCYTLNDCADENGVVMVVFGEHVLQFAGLPFEEPGVMDLGGVETPPTPKSRFD